MFSLPDCNPIDEYTEVRESPVSGHGCFAKKFIPKGTVWWNASMNERLVVKKEQWEVFKSSFRTDKMKGFADALCSFGYYSKEEDSIVLVLDNGRHVNHSETPNSMITPECSFASVALRDINVGEEIFEKYQDYYIPWCPEANYIE